MLVHLAGAASFCPPSLLISLSSLALPVCTPLCLIFFFFFPPPSYSFSVSQWLQLREAAVCASASQLPQVKTAASLDTANSKGGVGEAFAAAAASPHPGAGHAFLIISKKKASWRKGQAEDPGNQTNKSQADWEERRISGTEGKTNQQKDITETHWDIYFLTFWSPVDVFTFIYCFLRLLLK